MKAAITCTFIAYISKSYAEAQVMQAIFLHQKKIKSKDRLKNEASPKSITCIACIEESAGDMGRLPKVHWRRYWFRIWLPSPRRLAPDREVGLDRLSTDMAAALYDQRASVYGETQASKEVGLALRGGDRHAAYPPVRTIRRLC